MNTYQFSIDKKVTVWERNNYQIEANSQEEAEQKIAEIAKDSHFEPAEGFINCENLYETIEYMEPEDNGGQTTTEILDGNGYTIDFSKYIENSQP